jgi:Tol biopolymer transport system component
MSRLEDIESLIEINSRRLQELKVQQARYGIDTPVHITLEIRDIEAEIEELEQERDRLLVPPPPPPPEPPIPKPRQTEVPSSNNRLYFIAGGIAFIIVLLLVLGWLFWPKSSTPSTPTQVAAASPTPTVGPTPVSNPTPLQPTSASLGRTEPEATILSPSDGDQVPFQIWVRGEAFNLPQDRQLWLLVQTELENDYYPQPDPPVVGEDGQWAGTASFGHNVASSFMGHYSLWVVLVEPAVSREFQDFIDNWTKDQPLGMSLPETGLTQLDSVQLNRSIPEVRLLEPKAGSRVVQTELLWGSYANLDPELWQLYGVIAVSDQQFRAFGPAQFKTAEPDGWWTLEAEFDWPVEPDQPVTFYILAILANGAQHQQILERATRDGTLLTYEDLAGYGDYLFDPQGEPLAKNSFQRAEQIAFASDRPGNDDIFVINADGSGLTRLTTDPALDDDPAWSPDGTQIVFDSQRQGARQLYVMDADGSRQRPLISDREISGHRPAWSPDGQWIAFYAEQEGNTDIYKVKYDGTELTRLTTDPGQDRDPGWSPDGRYIVFQSQQAKVENGQPELYRMDADGNNPIRLTRNNTHEADPAWSPKGTSIIFSGDYEGDNDILVMDADGANLRRAANRDYDRQPSFAPDGERFVFDSSVNNRQLFLASLTGADKPVQLQTGLAKSFSPAWSPVDDRVAFVGRYDGDWEIYTVWGDGAGLERVTDNCWNEVQPRISPDGRWLVFASDAVGDFYSRPDDAACQQARNYNIWRVDLRNPTEPEQLTTSPAKEWQPAWSPNGKQLAFASDEAGNFDIYLMNADGTGRLQLTADQAEDSLPYWISDTEIVFYSGRSGDGDIYQVSAAGGEATSLVQNPGFDWSPAVSPDGRTLIFASTRDTEGSYPTELYALDLATGTINRLTEEIDNHDGTPLWSGDGRRIYFDSTRYYGAYDVWVMGLTEGMTVDENDPPKNLTEDDRSDRLGTP